MLHPWAPNPFPGAPPAPPVLSQRRSLGSPCQLPGWPDAPVMASSLPRLATCPPCALAVVAESTGVLPGHTAAPGGGDQPQSCLWMAHGGGPSPEVCVAEIAVPMASTTSTSSFLGIWSLCPAIIFPVDFLPWISEQSCSFLLGCGRLRLPCAPAEPCPSLALPSNSCLCTGL